MRKLIITIGLVIFPLVASATCIEDPQPSPGPWTYFYAEGQAYPHRVKSADGYIVFMGTHEQNAKTIAEAVTIHLSPLDNEKESHPQH